VLCHLRRGGRTRDCCQGPGTGVRCGSRAQPAGRRQPVKGNEGVFLINQLMDTVEFTEEGCKVLMRKHRNALAGSDTEAGRNSS
jgi:hypothetical protein